MPRKNSFSCFRYAVLVAWASGCGGSSRALKHDVPPHGIGPDDAAVIDGGSVSIDLGSSTPTAAAGATFAEPTPIRGRAVRLGVGLEHACAVLVDGDVYCWGANERGQLGAPRSVACEADLCRQARRNSNERCSLTRCTAQRVELGESSTELIAGEAFTCVIGASGRVTCWGDNRSGQIESSAVRIIASPTTIDLPGRATQLALGLRHACALIDNGTVVCWGSNDLGQRGTGRRGPTASLSPALLPGRAKRIAAGQDATCALLESGSLVCWGSNNRLQLGGPGGEACDATLQSHTAAGVSCRSRPVVVPELHSVTSIALGGEHGCAIDAGKLKCWGDNEYWKTGVVGDDGCAAHDLYRVPHDQLTDLHDEDDIDRFKHQQAAHCLEHPTEVPTERPASLLLLDGDRTCVASDDWRVDCWGSFISRDWNVPGVGAIALGRKFDCLLGRDGGVQCATAEHRWVVCSDAAQGAAFGPAPRLEVHHTTTSCARSPSRLSSCISGKRALAISDILLHRQQLFGSTIRVEGIVAREMGVMPLDSSQPTDQCSTVLALYDPDAAPSLKGGAKLDFKISGTGAGPACVGSCSDAPPLCCDIEPTQEHVVASGVLLSVNGRPVLTRAALCLK